MKIIANGIDIEVEDTGAGSSPGGKERPAVLLIMGLGMQLIAWPPALVQVLVDAGYRVIRHDNRDIGLSQHFDHTGKPNLVWAALKYRLRCAINSPYSVRDMAHDAMGVLDALKVEKAHVVADHTRASELRRITVPTLVLHGKADPLIPFACGEDTAKRIPGARLVGIEGMGHDLPSGVVQRLLESLLPHLDACHLNAAQLNPAQSMRLA